MKYGYARVSTPDQCLNLQLDALRLYGVDHICEEKISGKNKNKPVLDDLIAKYDNETKNTSSEIDNELSELKSKLGLDK